jgi:DNA-3-methyladenine glycosylase
VHPKQRKWNIGKLKIDNEVKIMVYKPINDSFFQQPTLSLARALLGKLLVKETELV